METIKLINFIIAFVFFICYAYQFMYLVVPFVKKRRLPEPGAKNRFAVLISARNEENVIGELLLNIRNQTYDPALYKVFVIADNCTDKTAEAARQGGAIVYERFNNELVGKGYALEDLFKHIGSDYAGCFDGYFVFDADNLLEPDYMERMNVTFSNGYEVVTSYRNSKNYDDNWITAGYALWFLRESVYLNGARSLLGVSCAISGTGFLFSQRIIDSTGGWYFHMLTEDIEFAVHHILRGVKIGFCYDAVLYDEQPTSFTQSWHQRQRWAKGYMQVFRAYGLRLLRGALGGNFTCFDMSMVIMPAIVLTTFSIISNTVMSVMGFLRNEPLLEAAFSIGQTLLGMYLTLLIFGAVTTFTEWKRINCGAFKKIMYMFTFPLFMFTYVPISFCAVFAKVEWKPIKHKHMSLSSLGARQIDARQIGTGQIGAADNTGGTVRIFRR